jgi:redox-sensing transcriptional repressor
MPDTVGLTGSSGHPPVNGSEPGNEPEPGTANGRPLPEATIARLPVYLRALYALAERGVSTVASDELAAAAGVNSAKLRKDLSHLGSYGIRGVGYDVDYLVYQVSRALGLTQRWPVVIVGAGNLGRALANYGGFVAAGVTSILNFAPLVLNVPEGVDVRKVDLSIELQILAFHAQRRSAERFGQVPGPAAVEA